MKPWLEKLSNVKLFCNRPRTELIEDLKYAKALIVTCPVESAPVTVFEAGAYGVRPIVFAKEKDGKLSHTTLSLLGNEAYGISISISNKAEIGKLLAGVLKSEHFVSTDSREYFRVLMLGKFGKENLAKRLEEICVNVKKQYHVKTKELPWTF